MDTGLYIGPDNAPDRYRLLRSIGRGGEAVLYLAELELGGAKEPVVVKMLDARQTLSQDLFAKISGKWREQAELLRFVHRLGVVGIREHFEGPSAHPAGGADDTGAGRALFLVMNHVEGLDLRDWRAERALDAPAERREAVRCLEQLADVLDWLHGGSATPSGRTVVHGDLSPGNVMIDTHGQATLVDFGLSKLTADHQTAEVWFTPGFAAPEVFEGKRSPATDRYAFGALAYFLLSGDSPATMPETLRAALLDLPELVALDTEKAARIATIFATDPADRPESLAAWVRELRPAVISTTRPPAPPKPAGPAPVPVPAPAAPAVPPPPAHAPAAGAADAPAAPVPPQPAQAPQGAAEPATVPRQAPSAAPAAPAAAGQGAHQAAGPAARPDAAQAPQAAAAEAPVLPPSPYAPKEPAAPLPPSPYAPEAAPPAGQGGGGAGGTGSTVPLTQQPVPGSGTGDGGGSGDRRRSRKPKVVLALVVAALLVGGGAYAGVALSGGKGDDKHADGPTGTPATSAPATPSGVPTTTAPAASDDPSADPSSTGNATFKPGDTDSLTTMQSVDSSYYGLNTGTAEVSGKLYDDVLRTGDNECDAGYVEYNLGRGYSTFDVLLGLDDNRKDLPMTFTITVDNSRLAHDRVSLGNPLHRVLNVSGALRLRVDWSSDSDSDCGVGVLANPKLER